MNHIQTEPGYLTYFTSEHTYPFSYTGIGASMEGSTTQKWVHYYHLSANQQGDVIYRLCGSRLYTSTTMLWDLLPLGILPN